MWEEQPTEEAMMEEDGGESRKRGRSEEAEAEAAEEERRQRIREIPDDVEDELMMVAEPLDSAWEAELSALSSPGPPAFR